MWTKKNICIAQWNCDSLTTKVDELQSWLCTNKVGVAMIQETKLRAEDGCPRVRGYEVVRRDRWRIDRNRWSRGGGLVTLVKLGWNYRNIPVRIPRDSPLEALALQVSRRGCKPLNVLNVYAPPLNSADLEEDLLRTLPGGNGEDWVICRDFNAHHRDWDRLARED